MNSSMNILGGNVCRASDKSYLEVPDTGIGIQEIQHKTLQYKQSLWGQEGLALWHNTSNTIRYKTIEHKHWGPKRLTQRPISDEWEKTQSGTVGVCISRRSVRLKKEKGLYTDLCAEKKCCTKMMTYDIFPHFYISVSLFTPNESGYTIILLIFGLRLMT